MYKLLASICLLLICNQTYADSFLSCATDVDSYSLEKGKYFKTCLLSSSKFQFRAVSIGSMGHTCYMKETAVLEDGAYRFVKDKCSITFIPTNKGMQVDFASDCWYRNCGMRANWKSGEYEKIISR